jgi:hypothetical protein
MNGPKSLDEAWTAFEAKNPDWENDKNLRAGAGIHEALNVTHVSSEIAACWQLSTKQPARLE